MKRVKFLLIAAVAVGSISLNACSKKEGCTDLFAVNYDSGATKDDGSCEYPGRVTFWHSDDDSLYATQVEINNNTDAIADGISSSPAGCESCFECANFQLNPGLYSYKATNTIAGKEWKGTVQILSDGCNIIHLQK